MLMASPCKFPRCPAPSVARGYCEAHKQEASRSDQAQRGTATQRGYHARWQRRRAGYLREHPLCVECLKEGRTEPAFGIDHIIPHRGNRQLFWDESNWQSLCQFHLNAKSGRGE